MEADDPDGRRLHPRPDVELSLKRECTRSSAHVQSSVRLCVAAQLFHNRPSPRRPVSVVGRGLPTSVVACVVDTDRRRCQPAWSWVGWRTDCAKAGLSQVDG